VQAMGNTHSTAEYVHLRKVVDSARAQGRRTRTNTRSHRRRAT